MATAPQIAARIKLARQLAGLTLEDASQKIGVSLRTYHRWETTANPEARPEDKSTGFLTHIDAIASAFGTSTEELTRDADQDIEQLVQEARELVDTLRPAIVHLLKVNEALGARVGTGGEG